MKSIFLLLFITYISVAAAQDVSKENTFVVKKKTEKKKEEKTTCSLIINDKEYFNNTPIYRAELKGLCTLKVLNTQTGIISSPTSFTWKVDDLSQYPYIKNSSDCSQAYVVSRGLGSYTITIENLQYSTPGGCMLRMTLPIK